MKNEEVRMKNEKEPRTAPEKKSRPGCGADSQLHNYNVMLTRLGDLFGDAEELEPPKSEK